jgi:uncharacterized protein with ParB-like and HNH nuclease domain
MLAKAKVSRRWTLDAQAKTVSEILIAPNQYLIPFFQRQYSWQRKHWKRLWDDIVVLLEDTGGSSQHFLGPLVCTPDKMVPAEIVTFQLIDGQQRLTTLMALMAALRKLARMHGQQPLVEQVTEQYLIHKYQEGHRRYRVLPRVSDREAFMAIIDEGELQSEQKKFGVVKAQQFFQKRIEAWIEKDPAARLKAVFRAVTSRMSLVVITIDGENPYEIFESLNSTGLPLQESDLIRNFVFMQVPTQKQDAFNLKHWHHLETIFGEGDEPRFSATTFYRNYLMRNGEFSRNKMTFVDFKNQNHQRQMESEDQVIELRRFAKLESMIRYPRECEDKDVTDALFEIAMLEVTTAHPLLLNLLDRWVRGVLPKDDLLASMRDLSSFVLRRSICGMSTRQYNRYFPEAVSWIDQSPKDDLRRYWIHRGWPDDTSFKERLCDFPIYQREPKKARHLLLQLEAATGHKEPIVEKELTIEHVMPQHITGNNGKTWREELGEDYFALHAKWIHTLGNLTLTGYNPDMSNSSFEDKLKWLVTKSKVSLNEYFNGLDAWGVEGIKQRAKAMIETTCGLWSVPADAPSIKEQLTEKDTDNQPIRAGKQRRIRYWKRFREVLHEADFPLQPLDTTHTTDMFFDIGHPLVTFWAWIILKKKELKAGFTFKRKVGKAIFRDLEKRRAELEEQLGFNLELDQKYGWITVSKSNVNIKETDKWPDQHEWLVTHLKAMHRVIGPAITEAANGAAESSSTSKRQLDYWYGFAAHLEGRDSTLKPQKPQAQHWMSMAIGRSGSHVSAICSTWNAETKSRDGEIRAEVVLDGKRSKIFYKALYAQKNEIEAELGERLIWHNPEDKQMCRIYVRKSADVYDCELWPKQYAWLQQNLEALRDAFSVRIKSIDPSESDIDN